VYRGGVSSYRLLSACQPQVLLRLASLDPVTEGRESYLIASFWLVNNLFLPVARPAKGVTRGPFSVTEGSIILSLHFGLSTLCLTCRLRLVSLALCVVRGVS
jgi:hypothetical protein